MLHWLPPAFQVKKMKIFEALQQNTLAVFSKSNWVVAWWWYTVSNVILTSREQHWSKAKFQFWGTSAFSRWGCFDLNQNSLFNLWFKIFNGTTYDMRYMRQGCFSLSFVMQCHKTRHYPHRNVLPASFFLTSKIDYVKFRTTAHNCRNFY